MKGVSFLVEKYVGLPGIMLLATNMLLLSVLVFWSTKLNSTDTSPKTTTKYCIKKRPLTWIPKKASILRKGCWQGAPSHAKFAYVVRDLRVWMLSLPTWQFTNSWSEWVQDRTRSILIHHERLFLVGGKEQARPTAQCMNGRWKGFPLVCCFNKHTGSNKIESFCQTLTGFQAILRYLEAAPVAAPFCQHYFVLPLSVGMLKMCFTSQNPILASKIHYSRVAFYPQKGTDLKSELTHLKSLNTSTTLFDATTSFVAAMERTKLLLK